MRPVGSHEHWSFGHLVAADTQRLIVDRLIADEIHRGIEAPTHGVRAVLADAAVTVEQEHRTVQVIHFAPLSSRVDSGLASPLCSACRTSGALRARVDSGLPALAALGADPWHACARLRPVASRIPVVRLGGHGGIEVRQGLAFWWWPSCASTGARGADGTAGALDAIGDRCFPFVAGGTPPADLGLASVGVVVRIERCKHLGREMWMGLGERGLPAAAACGAGAMPGCARADLRHPGGAARDASPGHLDS